MSGGPVAIVGAGLAGLRCAELLAGAGMDVRVYEASDGVGGRARTDRHGDFHLDRGFQVLLTAYPEARRAFDYEGLELGEFEPGAMIRDRDGFSLFADPVRRPRTIPAALRTPVGTLGDKLRLGKMWRRLISGDPSDILSAEDRPALEELEDRGFSEEVIERFFRPFFGGVFIDGELGTSSRLMDIFFRCFATGSAALPAGGMGRMAEQLAGRLPDDSIRLGRRVSELRPNAVRPEGGDWIDAAAVIIATDERQACALLGIEPPASGRTTACVYFDAPETDIRGRLLVLAPPGEGPINELAIPSSVAAGYAPPGRSLVAVSAVGDEARRTDLLASVTAQLAGWFGARTVDGWRHLSTKKVEHALPAFEPGRFRIGGISPKLESGIFICGDHRESPSIQGALVSGRKAAEAVRQTIPAVA